MLSDINTEVLQGTILGLFLLIVNINKIDKNQEECNVISYADDIIVVYIDDTW